MELTLILNLFSSFFLCGLIWTVQIVHYPAFHGFEKKSYSTWMSFHKSRISIVVVPVMLVELGSSILLSLSTIPYLMLHRIGLGVVVLVWLITFFIQVPLHEKLAGGYKESIAKKLVSSNRWRTLLWSLKSILGMYLLFRLIGL
ncbi:hypothetical protein [Rhodohalobacter mucosus]|uniref:DUF1772 domain-containing protein n=1 Tax=Rhodohalobacter mucosus TaxID=2079485 RepID=A0A316U0I6_9BACT|nr:hypothetical protein [Rhodohalobacter mucosus]PWN06206.1 hypothetical protein DDZ15_10250 [Rhodohalobacter mucosus]